MDGYAERRLVGELDMDATDRLAQALQPVFDRRVPTVVFDLSKLTFIDSSGLRQLVLTLNHQRSHGGCVVLHAPSASTLRVLASWG